MKTFVVLAGGAGVGKNYFIEHDPMFRNATVVDVDEIKKNVSVSNAVVQMKKDLTAAFERGDSMVVNPTIGGNVKGSVNKFILAKKYGYHTIAILLDGSPDAGLERVAKRVMMGGHSVPDEKVRLTYTRAAEAFPEIAAAADESKVIPA